MGETQELSAEGLWGVGVQQITPTIILSQFQSPEMFWELLSTTIVTFKVCTMLLSLIVDGDGCDNSLALFYAGTEPYFMQLKPTSYWCAKGRHGVDWFCHQALPSLVATHIVLSTQLVHSFGPQGTTAVSHYFLSSCFSQC